MARWVLGCLALIASVLSVKPAAAAFHQWDIKEVYSNADGTVQFIELIAPVGADGETQISGHTVTANGNVFTFDANLSGATGGKHLLLATPGFASIAGAVTPDFELPCGPFFDPSATTITISFSGGDSISFAGSTLPVDGTNSLTDTMPNGTTTLVSGADSPTNYAGQSGALNVTSSPDDGDFCNGVGLGGCGTPPCAEQCDEASDQCVECLNVGHCNDDNPCTDDSCDGTGTCAHADNSASCDDGEFCTGADICAVGVCINAGNPCEGDEVCDEASDQCMLTCPDDVEPVNGVCPDPNVEPDAGTAGSGAGGEGGESGSGGQPGAGGAGSEAGNGGSGNGAAGDGGAGNGGGTGGGSAGKGGDKSDAGVDPEGEGGGSSDDGSCRIAGRASDQASSWLWLLVATAGLISRRRRA